MREGKRAPTCSRALRTASQITRADIMHGRYDAVVVSQTPASSVHINAGVEQHAQEQRMRGMSAVIR